MIDRARFCAAIGAFGVHFFISILVALGAAYLVFGVWFPYPLRYLAGGLDLFWILISVDVICGPVLTGVLFNPRKSNRELVVDLSLIGVIQLSALIYGVYSIGQARPVALVFESDRFVAVSASQVDTSALSQALPEWQSLSWTGPIQLATRASRSGAETLQSIQLSTLGLEPSARPGWWQSYDLSRTAVQARMKPLRGLRQQKFSEEQAVIDEAVRKIGANIENIYFLPLVSQKSLDQWVVLLNSNAEIVGYASVGGF
jgi:hypothetical protein